MGNGNSITGYRILRVKANSPAAEIAVEPMLDFIVYPPPDTTSTLTFSDYISTNENKEVELTIFNMATQQMRKCKLTPRKWEGDGLLGFVVNQENYKEAHAQVIHVLDFLVDGPMYDAGLKPRTDYIIGTEHYIFTSFKDFSNFISTNEKKPINLFVYNSEEEKARIVTLVPNKDWGGPGSLGGDVGIGHFHSLPIRKKVEEGNKVENNKIQENTEVTSEITNATESKEEEAKSESN